MSGALGAAIAFVIGYGLWAAGAWAGGDVKLFTALGALLPTFSPPSAPSPYSSGYPLFPVTVLLNGLLLSAPVLLAHMAICRLRGRGALYERVKITDLKEGMIPAEVIYEKDGEIGRWSSRWGLKPEWDRAYTDPRRAAGLTRRQVGVLRRLARERKIENEIKIKREVPFAPALCAGVFAAVFYGDIYWKLSLALLGG